MFHYAFARNRAPAGPSFSVPSGTYEHAVIDPANANCTITFNSNGTCTMSAGSMPSTASNWATPSATGSAYDISFDSGASWLNLSLPRQLTAAKSTGIGTATVGPTAVWIRPAGGGSNLATGSITLMATVDA